jgi:hypothetical protein
MALFDWLFGGKQQKAAGTQSPSSGDCADATLDNALNDVPAGAQSPIKTSEQACQQPSPSGAGAKAQAALDRYQKIQASRDLGTFINDYDERTLVAMVESLDIARLPVNVDTPGMHGMLCMKILELSRWLSGADRKEAMRACHRKLAELSHMEWRKDNAGVYADVMFKLGMDVTKDGNDAMAYGILESISAHGGKSPEAVVWQGACALNMGNNQTAREHFEQVLRIDPSNRMASDLIKRC